MKQIYQKLLMSLALVAFFGTLLSAQVLSRSQVDAKEIQTQQETMSELKVKAKAQGLKKIPTSWLQEVQQEKRDRLVETRGKKGMEAKPSTNQKAFKKPNVERKLIGNNQQNIYERAKQITPPPGFKVVIKEIGGKQYIEFAELPNRQGKIPARVKN